MNAQILTLWERERMGEFWEDMGWHWAATGFGEHIKWEVVRMNNGATPE